MQPPWDARYSPAGGSGATDRSSPSSAGGSGFAAPPPMMMSSGGRGFQAPSSFNPDAAAMSGGFPGGPPNKDYQYLGPGMIDGGPGGSFAGGEPPPPPKKYPECYYVISGILSCSLATCLLLLVLGVAWDAWSAHQQTDTAVMAAAAPSARGLPAVSEVYDCSFAGTDYSVTMSWSTAQKSWCCDHYGCGCNSTSLKYGDPPPATCRQQDYDCGVGRPRAWTKQKKAMCCDRYGCGCPDEGKHKWKPQQLVKPPCPDGLVSVQVRSTWLNAGPTCEYPKGAPGLEVPPDPKTGKWEPFTYHRCQCPAGQVHDHHGKCVELSRCPEEQRCMPHMV